MIPHLARIIPTIDKHSRKLGVYLVILSPGEALDVSMFYAPVGDHR